MNYIINTINRINKFYYKLGYYIIRVTNFIILCKHCIKLQWNDM